MEMCYVGGLLIDTFPSPVTKYCDMSMSRSCVLALPAKGTSSQTEVHRKESGVEQRYAITVKFLVTADSAEDAEEMVETACEKATASYSEMSYEGIEDIEEEEDE